MKIFKCKDYIESTYCVKYLNSKGYYFQNKRINNEVKSFLLHKDVRNIFIYKKKWSRDGKTYKQLEWSGSCNKKFIFLSDIKPLIINDLRKKKLKNILKK